MEFKHIALQCKWRVISRGLSICKACTNQPNGQLCSKNDCAPYQFARIMTNETQVKVHRAIKDLARQLESRLNNNKTMIGYASETEGIILKKKGVGTKK